MISRPVDLTLSDETRGKVNSDVIYFGVMSKRYFLLVYAMIKGDMVISTKSCLSAGGHQ
jgi:hypothetical protein